MLFIATELRLFLICCFLAFPGSMIAQETVYKIDELNGDLGVALAELDRSSPQAVIEALLDLSETGNFSAAAHLLNLATVPKPQQADVGSQLSEKLHAIVDRKVVISWADLSDRPDALDANATTKSAVAGQSRRSILLWTLTVEDRPYPIYLDRVQVGEAAPVWVFSERSVAKIEKFYDAFGPSKLERKLPA